MPAQIMYFVYLLLCKDNSIYTGISTDVERRFLAHKNGKGGHYTKSHPPIKIIYIERHPTKSSALKREAHIKKLPRSKKLEFASS